AFERDRAVLHADVEVARVEIAVLGESLADVLTDPLVGALVAARAPPGVRPGHPCARAGARRAARTIPLSLAAPCAISAGGPVARAAVARGPAAPFHVPPLATPFTVVETTHPAAA